MDDNHRTKSDEARTLEAVSDETMTLGSYGEHEDKSEERDKME